MVKKSAFSKAKTIADITLIAKRLKEEGADPNEVNAMAFQKKKELLTATSKVCDLKKVITKASSVSRNKYSHIRLKATNLRESKITLHTEGYVVEI